MSGSICISVCCIIVSFIEALIKDCRVWMLLSEYSLVLPYIGVIFGGQNIRVQQYLVSSVNIFVVAACTAGKVASFVVKIFVVQCSTT